MRSAWSTEKMNGGSILIIHVFIDHWALGTFVQVRRPDILTDTRFNGFLPKPVQSQVSDETKTKSLIKRGWSLLSSSSGKIYVDEKTAIGGLGLHL